VYQVNAGRGGGRYHHHCHSLERPRGKGGGGGVSTATRTCSKKVVQQRNHMLKRLPTHLHECQRSRTDHIELCIQQDEPLTSELPPKRTSSSRHVPVHPCAYEYACVLGGGGSATR
jgi:hypothetical protein